jgi:capsular polysaccharide transport system permease protein
VSLATRPPRSPAVGESLPEVVSAAAPPAQADARALVRFAPRLPAVLRPRTALAARPSLRTLSFVALVLLPTAVAAAYFFAVASDQYVAEFRFTLNSVDPPRFDPLSMLIGGAAQSPATIESQVLVQYMTSRAIIDEIDAALDVRALFSPPAADWWARLPRAASIEELVHYWKGQVDPFYDPADGTVAVRLRAFTPEDALRLSQAVVAANEHLVNDLSARARRDLLRHADAEVAQTESRLKSVLAGIRAFRDREGMIDPERSADATSALAARLRDDLVKANAELTTLKAYMRDDAPTVKVLKARIRSLEAQRRSLAREMTDPNPANPNTLSRTLGSYEQLESDRKFAEAAYQHALAGLDQARANADRQHVFVASFVPPSLPEESLYPRRWRAVGTVALLALALWGIGGLAAQSIRDHLA